MAATATLKRPAAREDTNVTLSTLETLTIETSPGYVGIVQVVRELTTSEILAHAWDPRHCYASRTHLYGVYDAQGKRVCIPDHQAELEPGMHVSREQLDRWHVAWLKGASLPALVN